MRRHLKNNSLRAAIRFCVLAMFVMPALAGCGMVSGVSDFINTKTKFSSKEYGVKASPRVTNSRHVPKGGGRYMVGKPYKVAGRWYKPEVNPRYDNTGAASWYGPNFHGRQTANGEIFDQFALTAAHPTLPLPSYVRVTNLENNRSIVVRVNDRGPFVGGREIDLSKRAAEMLDYTGRGTARVRVKYVGEAPLEGDDTKMLLASFNAPTRMERSGEATTQIAFAEPVKPVRRLVGPVGRTLAPAPTPREGVLVTPEGFNVVVSPNGATGLGPLYYAPPGFDGDQVALEIDNAFAAAEAMATRPTELEAWRSGVDEAARNVRIKLGVFKSAENAQRVQDSFALIGAVDVEELEGAGGVATRLTLTYLKPGATRADAANLIRELGLTGVILY